MSKSSLTNVTILNNHYSSRQGNKIDKITIHHMAGNLSVEACGNLFKKAQASSNYGVGSDGRVGCYVEEENRAWTTANPANDRRAINIEVANDGGAPDWHVSDVALEKTIELCVDICRRYGIAKLNYTGTKDGNLTRHNMFMATTCPGPYLQSKFPYIADEVNRRLNNNIKYRAHLQDIGWQDWKTNGETAGTVMESRRLEAIQIDAPFEVEAEAHLEDIGWVNYGKINKDTIIGTVGESRRLECLKLKGPFEWRVHIQESGWTCWTNADGICTLGSVGQALRIEAIEIRQK